MGLFDNPHRWWYTYMCRGIGNGLYNRLKTEPFSSQTGQGTTIEYRQTQALSLIRVYVPSEAQEHR